MTRPKTIKLTKDEWTNLVMAIVGEFGIDVVKSSLVQAIGENRANKLINDKKNIGLTKQDHISIIKELYELAPGKTREDKIQWAISLGLSVFGNTTRFSEILAYVFSRVSEYESQPSPEIPDSDRQWKTTLTKIPAKDGVVTFYTRNVEKASGNGRNKDGGFEWIISRITGDGFERLLIMVMGGNRPPSRIFLDGDFENSKFPVPLAEEAKWVIRGDGRKIEVELNDKVIFYRSGNYRVTGATMNGYAKRGFRGEWAV